MENKKRPDMEECVIKYKDNFYLRTEVGYKKIILTTDQDLIAEGIQPIPDEFLEWFVKNPSCEEVEVISERRNWKEINWITIYKIIIPKEEPKIFIKKEYVDDQDAYGYDVIVKEKSKQETPEEAILRIKSENEHYIDEVAFELGVKWQQERSYSEEEVYNIIQQLRLQLKTGVLKWQDDFEFDLSEWFEQFSKLKNG